jgi:hypothetical protein
MSYTSEHAQNELANASSNIDKDKEKKKKKKDDRRIVNGKRVPNRKVKAPKY